MHTAPILQTLIWLTYNAYTGCNLQLTANFKLDRTRHNYVARLPRSFQNDGVGCRILGFFTDEFRKHRMHFTVNSTKKTRFLE